MRITKCLVFAMIPMFAATAVAEGEEDREMKIVIGGAVTGDDQTIQWSSSNVPGFDMHGMQVGETQSIIDETGRSILVTREQDGFRFDVDGKSISVPAPGVPGEYLTLAGTPDSTATFDVEIVGDQPAMPDHALPVHRSNTVTIITDEPLDASTQESIRAVLVSAGRDDEVSFVDRSGGFAGRRLHAIRMMQQVEQ